MLVFIDNVHNKTRNRYRNAKEANQNEQWKRNGWKINWHRLSENQPNFYELTKLTINQLNRLFRLKIYWVQLYISLNDTRRDLDAHSHTHNHEHNEGIYVHLIDKTCDTQTSSWRKWSCSLNRFTPRETIFKSFKWIKRRVTTNPHATINVALHDAQFYSLPMVPSLPCSRHRTHGALPIALN